MHVRVTRRGGLTGIPLRGELETTELPSEQARLAEAALVELPLTTEARPPTHPDAFQYDIELPGGHVLTVDESELSDVLQPLIQAALAHGTLG
jgi:hypothetical protein